VKVANQSIRLRHLIKLAGAMLAVAAVYPSLAACAGTLTVLQSFGQSSQNGYIPQNVVMGSDGALYGTAEGGGAKGHGIVYRLTRKKGTSDWTEEVLYSFGTHANDGNQPSGIVVTSDGAIFGTTRSGGKYSGGACSAEGCGAAFEVVSADGGKTWKESILHNFKGFPTDGAAPGAGFLADKNASVNGFPTFYGTTTIGGSGHNETICGDQGCGTLYELTHENSGWKVTTLHNYKGKDGFSPQAAPTIDKAGNLYVSTPLGGTASSDVRSSNQGPGKLSRQKPFGPAAYLYLWGGLMGLSAAASPDPNGYTLPSSHAVNRDATSVIGTAYGGGAVNSCTSNGASGCGTVYLLNAKSNPKAMWAAQLVHKFKGGTDGAGPSAGLTLDSNTGVYYGVTSGEESPSTDVGTIFALTPSKKSATGYEYSRLFRFNGKNGGYPRSNLVIDKGVLYGTTGGGGKYAFGTVFAFKP
jgi:uncharacterized repeat protein (TIGR03803 family)